MATLAHNLQNDTRLKDLDKRIEGYADDKANGELALPRTAMELVRAATDNVLTLEVDKTTNEDHAYGRYRVYMKRFGKKLGENGEHDASTIKKGASEFRAFIKLGIMTTVDGIGVLDRAQTMHGTLEKKGRKPLYAGLYKVALEQVKQSDEELTDDQIAAYLSKEAADPKTQMQRIKAMVKAAEAATKAEDAVPAINEKLEAIASDLAALIGFLEDEAKAAADKAKLAELQAKYGILPIAA